MVPSDDLRNLVFIPKNGGVDPTVMVRPDCANRSVCPLEAENPSVALELKKAVNQMFVGTSLVGCPARVTYRDLGKDNSEVGDSFVHFFVVGF